MLTLSHTWKLRNRGHWDFARYKVGNARLCGVALCKIEEDTRDAALTFEGQLRPFWVQRLRWIIRGRHELA